MAEILGLGLSHYPPLSTPDAQMAAILRTTLNDPGIPDELKAPQNWPPAMRTEWGDDLGVAAAAGHRTALVAQFRKVRAALDEFRPDVVLIWGDDQYENFKEDVIPPFTVCAYDDMDLYPWRHAMGSSMMSGKPNAWGEGADKHYHLRGRRDGRVIGEDEDRENAERDGQRHDERAEARKEPALAMIDGGLLSPHCFGSRHEQPLFPLHN